MIKLKQGAMFGLDARIALAIFGALSVISGAALYSAIQEAKVIAIIQDFEEIGKALESMYIDTAQMPPEYTPGSNKMDVSEFISSTVSGWRGPYLSYSVDVNGRIEYTIGKMSIGAYHMSRSSLQSTVNAPWLNKMADVVIFVADGLSISLFNGIDERVDGGDGPLAGKVQAYQAGNSTTSLTGTTTGIMYNVRPVSMYK